MPTLDRTSPRSLLLPAGFLALGVAFVLSAIEPFDRLTWWLEVAPVILGAVLAFVTRRRFPLTHLLYGLLIVHGLILVLGGHYTYARVPLGFWLQDAFDFARNPYDRIGHFAQGFVPAILVRELLLRTSPLRPGRWLFVLTCAVCLAFSACYELVEWIAAVILDEGAESFLGTQGDEWDTQWDMALALVGAVTSLALLGRAHDRGLERLDRTASAPNAARRSAPPCGPCSPLRRG